MSERALLIVIVAYGPAELLGDCLAALDGCGSTVVVDNSSSAQVHAIASEARARYLDPGSNLGFAAAINRVLEDADDLAGTDVLLLNPDSAIDPESISGLRTCLAKDGRLACVAPVQRHPGSTAEDRVGWPFPTPTGVWIEAVGLGGLRRREEFVIGSVLLVRGEALVAVGGFDERFFLYAEETDWQRRASRQGWRVGVCHEIWATHIGAATDASGYRRELRFHTGAERYIRKYHGRLGWASYRLASLIGATARAVLLSGERRYNAAIRARIYAVGPDRLARTAGVVPPPVPRVPALSSDRPPGHLMGPVRLGSHAKRPLRILLDARDVGINQKGVARVLEEIVPRLLDIDPDRYEVVATSVARDRFAGIGSKKLKAGIGRSAISVEQVVLPSIASRLGVDAIYCHRECSAIWGPPVLLHVTEDPEVRWARESDPPVREQLRRLYSRVFMDRALQRARVVTSTHSTRSDLIRRNTACEASRLMSFPSVLTSNDLQPRVWVI